jgi:hypothetical protein
MKVSLQHKARLLGAAMAATVVMLSGLQVDAGAPAGRYVLAGTGTTGTVTDKRTKLVWQQTAANVLYSWAGAKTYCAGIGASLGGTGWRVPTIKELTSLIDFASVPHIDQTAFPNAIADVYWSATPMEQPSAGGGAAAWVIYFQWAFIALHGRLESGLVRCVR